MASKADPKWAGLTKYGAHSAPLASQVFTGPGMGALFRMAAVLEMDLVELQP